MTTTELSSNDVWIEKSTERRSDEELTVRFEIESCCEKTVAIRFVDSISREFGTEDVAVDHVDRWGIRPSGELVWLGSVAPGDVVEAHYAVRLSDSDPASLESLEQRPRLDGIRQLSDDTRVPPAWQSADDLERPAHQVPSLESTVDRDETGGDDGSGSAGESGRTTDRAASDDRPGDDTAVDVDRYRLRISIADAERATAGTAVVHGLANATSLVEGTPSVSEIRDGSFDGAISLTVESALDDRLITNALESIDGVESVDAAVLETDVGGDASRSEPSTRDVFDDLRESIEPAEPDAIEAELSTTSFKPVECDGSGDWSVATGPDAEEVSITDLVGETQPETTKGDRSTTSGDDVDHDAVVDALVEALEGDGGESRAVKLRDALGLESRRSLETRVDHLQSRTEAVLAYEDALAAFLDENGTAALLEELTARIEHLEDDVGRLRDDLERLGAEGSDRDERIDAVEGDLDGLEAELEDVIAWREQLSAAFESPAAER
ncbi:hypothetical protein ACFOZ7_06355 [Natribaculum luteum]|uniref:Chemotaxis protein CheA P2 response regulator-binding domain-containing protein n=1 Tax=Natribaculum luteum TaxID=1586232 RepID=A0ABD5NWX2_9EURY|nr:hypothetical protein [Natribaculum luteum]